MSTHTAAHRQARYTIRNSIPTIIESTKNNSPSSLPFSRQILLTFRAPTVWLLLTVASFFFFAARCVPLMPRVDTRYFKSELCRRGMQINAFIMLDILLSAEIYIYLVNKRICLQTLPRNAFWRCYVAFTGPYLY